MVYFYKISQFVLFCFVFCYCWIYYRKLTADVVWYSQLLLGGDAIGVKGWGNSQGFCRQGLQMTSLGSGHANRSLGRWHSSPTDSGQQSSQPTAHLGWAKQTDAVQRGHSLVPSTSPLCYAGLAQPSDPQAVGLSMTQQTVQMLVPSLRILANIPWCPVISRYFIFTMGHNISFWPILPMYKLQTLAQQLRGTR